MRNNLPAGMVSGGALMAKKLPSGRLMPKEQRIS